MPHYKLVEMMIISFRIRDIGKTDFEQNVKFHTKAGTPTPVIYVIQNDFNRYQKFNTNKL